jgi:hypothetical protein
VLGGAVETAMRLAVVHDEIPKSDGFEPGLKRRLERRADAQ